MADPTKTSAEAPALTLMADAAAQPGATEPPVAGSPAETSASNKAAEQQQTDEDEVKAKDRSKLRIYAIVAALYLVLFIAALDQTIIA